MAGELGRPETRGRVLVWRDEGTCEDTTLLIESPAAVTVDSPGASWDSGFRVGLGNDGRMQWFGGGTMRRVAP